MTDGWIMDLFDAPMEELPPPAFFTRCTWCNGIGWPMIVSVLRNGCNDIMEIFVCCPCCALDDEGEEMFNTRDTNAF